MQPSLLAPPVRSSLDTRTPEFQENRDAMLKKLDEIEALLDEAELGVFEGEHKVNFSDEFSGQMYHDFLKDEINVVLPGGAENLRMLDQRILPALEKIMHAMTHSGHTLLVGHRNVNKMIVKNLLGLTIEKGYRVEHENNWLYIYAPQRKELFHTTITAPNLPIEVAPGYREIE